VGATEEANFKLSVTAGQAQAELDKTRTSALSLGGGLERVKGGLEKFDAGARESSKVLRGLGGIMGESHSQALEFLGLAGDLAGAFASGGFFAVGMAAGTFVVKEVAEAYQESATNAKILEQAMPGLSQTIVRLKDAALVPGKQALEDFRKQLHDFGKDSRQIAIDAQQLLLTQLQQRQTNLSLAAQRENEELVALARSKLRGGNVSAEDIKQQSDVLQLVQERKKATDEMYDSTLKGLVELHSIDQQLDKKEAAKKYQDALNGAGIKSGADVNEYMRRKYGLTPQEAHDAEQKQIDDNLEQTQKWAQDRLAYDKSLADARARLREAEFQAEQEKLKQQLALRKQFASEALGIGVSASQELLDAVITGQDHALEHFAAAIAKQAGTALIGHGMDAAAGGIAMLSLGNPAGAVPLATGLGLIAGGVAMGGVATGIEHVAGGGTLFQKLPDRTAAGAATHSGINTGGGGSRGSGGGGQTIVNIVNGAIVAPAPQDQGREVQRVLEARFRSSGMGTNNTQGPRR
jgi:hypothetical protein